MTNLRKDWSWEKLSGICATPFSWRDRRAECPLPDSGHLHLFLPWRLSLLLHQWVYWLRKDFQECISSAERWGVTCFLWKNAASFVEILEVCLCVAATIERVNGSFYKVGCLLPCFVIVNWFPPSHHLICPFSEMITFA